MHALATVFFLAGDAFACWAIYATIRPRLARIVEVLKQGL